MMTTMTTDSDAENTDSGSAASSVTTYVEDEKPDVLEDRIAEKESRAVVCSKVLVFSMLTIAALAVGATAYLVIRDEERNKFEAQFKTYAIQIISHTGRNANSIFRVFDLLGTAITSTAKENNLEWPFVTIADFEAKATRVLKSSGAAFLLFAPLVETESLRQRWEQYTAENTWWLDETFRYWILTANGTDPDPSTLPKVFPEIMTMHHTVSLGPAPYSPIWQISGTTFPFVQVNVDLFSIKPQEFDNSGRPILGVSTFAPDGSRSIAGRQSMIVQPILDDIDTPDRKVVAFMLAMVDWRNYFTNVLASDANMAVVLSNTCTESVTFEINGPTVEILGAGDLHDPKYDDLVISSPFANEALGCQFNVDLYPTEELEESFTTYDAIYYTIGVAAIFGFTAIVFLVYDFAVRQRQRKVMDVAIRTDRVVASLFPSNFRDRLFQDQELNLKHGKNRGKNKGSGSAQNRLKTFLFDPTETGTSKNTVDHGKPIADLFLHATVLYADISGFTAWSSAREPVQIISFLETVYGAFDQLARRHGVFKVETIGDCYVAVTGLPEPQEDHALIMARFARDCMRKMAKLMGQLEVAFGPETGDMALRIGLHSGQVTAGVLRGDRARFQLFGDSVHTASQMEDSGKRNKIQISKTTADLLQSNGMQDWVIPRQDKITVRGKGQVETFWLETRNRKELEVDHDLDSSNHSSNAKIVVDMDGRVPTDAMRTKLHLVEWNVEVFTGLLKHLMASREQPPQNNKILWKTKETKVVEVPLADIEGTMAHKSGSTVMDEFKEIIALPQTDPSDVKESRDPSSIKLKKEVVDQLRDFIGKIASSYRDNPFHNFEHACHVIASVMKMLTRIVNYGECDGKASAVDIGDRANNSFGIATDPMTQFAVVFSALVHDADHSGVSNAQLVKEKTEIALKFKDKSVAEQHSVVVSWDLLMDPQYKDLRACIYANEDEFKRFRQLVVNVVLATDVIDKELQALRRARWDKAFSENSEILESLEDQANRKATIVIEHLIQASDVSHTMQHWKVFRKWNERLFEEIYKAHKAGRAPDPSEGWYKGEIGFFDFYIIPLAKKLENCGVFGVSSDEYLNYAQSNREEWALKGEEIVKEMVKKHKGS